MNIKEEITIDKNPPKKKPENKAQEIKPIFELSCKVIPTAESKSVKAFSLNAHVTTNDSVMNTDLMAKILSAIIGRSVPEQAQIDLLALIAHNLNLMDNVKLKNDDEEDEEEVPEIDAKIICGKIDDLSELPKLLKRFITGE